MKKSLFVLILFLLLAGCNYNSSAVSSSGSYDAPNVSIGENHIANYVTVKYRDTKVDVADPSFKYLDTSGSSFVNGAWYDEENEYMIIKLKSTYYHYCGLPKNVWVNFSNASSFGTYFNASIKDRYDCRSGFVPSYN